MLSTVYSLKRCTCCNLCLNYLFWFLKFLCNRKEMIEIAITISLLFIGLPELHGYQVDNNPYSHREVLDKNGKYLLEWMADLKKSWITFNVTVRTKGYVGLGLSRKGKMSGADVVIGGVLPNGQIYFSDRHAKGNQLPVEDPSQDWTLHEAWESETHTFLSFSRNFETCDQEHDLEIHGNVVGVLWAFGENDDEVEYHYQNRGVFWAYLLDPDLTPRELKLTEGSGLAYTTKRFGKWGVLRLTGNEEIPEKETTYICKIYRTSVSRKSHMIGFRTILPTEVDVRHIHHFVLLRCVAPSRQNADNLFEPLIGIEEECYINASPPERIPVQHCSDYVYVWGVGQLPTFFPEHVGLPLEPNEYFMLQLHFDNPNQLRNVRVNYSIEIFYTENLRQNDAGLLALGAAIPSSPSIMVPPNSLAHEIYGHCAAECTQSFVPPEGIRVFIGFLHTHVAGRSIRIHHFRGNQELPWIVYDDNYNFNFQQSHVLPKERLILPGDQLYVRCIYDNTNSTGNVTVGGYSTKDEMCAAAIVYYSRILNRPGCHSEIESEEYSRFLQIYNTTWSNEQVEMIVTSPQENAGLLVSQVGNLRIDWNLENRKRLQDYHRNLPQVSKCPVSTSARVGSRSRPLRKRSLKRVNFWSELNFSENDEMGQAEAFEFASVYPWRIKPYRRPTVCTYE